MKNLAPWRGPAPWALVLLWLVLLCGSAAAGQVPEFWIKNLEGTRFDATTRSGPIVVSFFFVGCVPCIKEIPMLYDFMQREFPQAALLFVDPVQDDSGRSVAEFAHRLNVPDKFFYRDPLGRLLRKFFSEQIAFPTIVGVRDGNLVFRLAGINEGSLQTIRDALRR